MLTKKNECRASGEFGLFFRLASELLARVHENGTSCEPDLVDRELKRNFQEIEDKVGLLGRLRRLREQGDLSKIKNHTILAFREDDTVEIFGYTKPSRAVKKEQELLSDPQNTNVVYVQGSPATIRSSYRNYLTNPADFVDLLETSLARL
jgi:hypothetical protein